MTAQKLAPSVSLFILIIMMAGFALAPFSVRATVPTIDFTAIGKLILQLGELIFQSGQLSALVVKEYVLDPAVKLLASIMLQAITQAIISWIQSGGNTNFVSNLTAALTRAADEAAGEFLNQLAGINLCSPFAFNIRAALSLPDIRLSRRLSCSATDILKNLQTSYDEFLRDFSRGGWLAYKATVIGPNNYTGALIASLDAKLMAESRRVSVVQSKYQAGSGFLGVNVKQEDCTEVGLDGRPLCTTVDFQTTPGALVVDQVKKVFGSGIDQAVNTDELAEAINAIITALIYKLISSSLAGLASNNTESGLRGPDVGAPSPLPPPPPAPEQISIKADIQRITTVINQDINPTLVSINAIMPSITTALNRFAPGSTSYDDPSVVRLRTVRDQLLTNQANLASSQSKLQQMQAELRTIDSQINIILQNPNQVPVENLGALYSRARQISQDISAEINDAINPTVNQTRSLISEAQSLINTVNTLPVF